MWGFVFVLLLGGLATWLAVDLFPRPEDREHGDTTRWNNITTENSSLVRAEGKQDQPPSRSPESQLAEVLKPLNLDVLGRSLYVKQALQKQTLRDKKRTLSSPVILSIFDGRLGNLMFEVASCIGLASTLNISFVFYPRAQYLEEFFDFYPVFPNLRLFEILTESDYKSLDFQELSFTQWGKYEPEEVANAQQIIASGKSLDLDGFFQSFKYFEHESAFIRELFAFPEPLVKRAKQEIARLKLIKGDDTSRPTVAIHIRRGDYLVEQSLAFGYVLPSVSYYLDAIRYFRRTLTNPFFIVVSEEIQWPQFVLGKYLNSSDLAFTSLGSAYADLCLVTSADHVIISVGTFSWWAGFLNTGKVVYFPHIARNSSAYAKGFAPEDYFPPSWIPHPHNPMKQIRDQPRFPNNCSPRILNLKVRKVAELSVSHNDPSSATSPPKMSAPLVRALLKSFPVSLFSPLCDESAMSHGIIVTSDLDPSELGGWLFEFASVISICMRFNYTFYFDGRDSETLSFVKDFSLDFQAFSQFRVIESQAVFSKFNFFNRKLVSDRGKPFPYSVEDMRFSETNLRITDHPFHYSTFASFRHDIRSLFLSPSPEIAQRVNDVLAQRSPLLTKDILSFPASRKSSDALAEAFPVRAHNRPRIFVHAPSAYYLSEQKASEGYVLPAGSYYVGAFSYFLRIANNPVFVVVSDKPSWAKELILKALGTVDSIQIALGKDLFFISLFSDAELLTLSLLSDHAVISTTPLSWWCGFLNPGAVYYFSKWAREKSEAEKRFSSEGFFPKDWIPSQSMEYYRNDQ